mmetsp:Transcript_11227/g.16482  ORF Transcript_11227/g.16482 Transcript_11227/m.16482 type:complete len:863 (+) Transcript_11227:218-2806(+)
MKVKSNNIHELSKHKKKWSSVAETSLKKKNVSGAMDLSGCKVVNPSAPSCVSTSDWTAVTGKKKFCTSLLLSQAKNPTEEKNEQKKTALTQNKFYLCKSMENKLHSSNLSNLSSSESTNGLKCFKRNQRRARKNAEKRVALELQARAQTLASSSSAPQNTILGKRKTNEIPSGNILALPDAMLETVLSFLGAPDVLKFGTCNKMSQAIGYNDYLWKSIFVSKYPESKLISIKDRQRTPEPKKSAKPKLPSKQVVVEIGQDTKVAKCEDLSLAWDREEWKLAYQLTNTNMLDLLRCSHSQQSFFETILGVGVNFTVNPKKKEVDYIELGQDFWSKSSFNNNQVDTFGKSYIVFLPLYFSKDHFKRALPFIKQAIVQLSRGSTRFSNGSCFEPAMVLDILPRIIITFIVLMADEGITTSRKSFGGLLRVYRLFLGLATEYPIIRKHALSRLRAFAYNEENRKKKKCPRLGELLPLLLIVDEASFSWRHIREAYLEESFIRSALWTCKAHPKLEHTHDANGMVEPLAKGEERVALTREAMTVSMRLTMFNVYFLYACCRGNTKFRSHACDIALRRSSIKHSATKKDENLLDDNLGDATAEKAGKILSLSADDFLSFNHFQIQVTRIIGVLTWRQFFHFIRAPCPSSKVAMARLLRQAVQKSRQRGYHKAGMDFSRIHASGTSLILQKGQQYSASSDLRRVIFSDYWEFADGRIYLDATCLVYKGRERVHTIDYSHRLIGNDYNSSPIRHSGDIMNTNNGTHTIHLDLEALNPSITTCFFVLSAWNGAKLRDVTKASVSFRNADSDTPLCEYNLDAQDKIDHLTSVIMCKLYRARGGWHVVTIGDSHKGHADEYGPINEAADKLVL